MLYREIIAVCSEIHTNTLCGQNVEFVSVKDGGTYNYSNRRVLACRPPWHKVHTLTQTRSLTLDNIRVTCVLSLPYADLILSDVTLVSALFSTKIHLPVLSVNKVHSSHLQFFLLFLAVLC
jgi:hypothetical protein